MKTIFTITLALFTTLIFADSHVIIKQNGEKLDVNYLTTKDNMIYYSFAGSTNINEISTFAVDQVIEKSTKNVILDNTKIDVSGKSGYKNVAFLESNQTNGLQKEATLKTLIHKAKGKTRADWVEQAKTRIQKQAAEQGLPFVIITNQTDSQIEAVAYNY